MRKRIRKVGILGSGTMGSGIAAHLANAGIRSYLLDIVPATLTEQEKAQGLTLDNPKVRNRIAETNKQLLLKSRPAQLMSKDAADLIVCGNIEDHLAWLSECDWVLEVVPENLEIKKAVLQKIQPFIKPGTIVSTNTSSISVNKIAEDMPLEFRKYWLGTHFFNPVRYMKLVEIIPCTDTLPEVVEFMAGFAEKTLGKGIVYAKDTPAFVANRLGNWAGPSAVKLMLKYGLTVAEVDAITGSVIGRPNTGTFGLYDLVGLDIGMASTSTVRNNVSDPEEQEMFTLPDFFQKMMEKGLLGNKTKAGFYKRQGKERLMFDINTLEYVPVQVRTFGSLEAAKKEKSLAKRLEIFFESDDEAGRFVWEHIKGLFLYAASKIPEVSENILNMDRSLKWGYNHAEGPFGLWTGLDLEKYVKRMEEEGSVVPVWVKEMLAQGFKSFYKQENGVDYYYSIQDKKYVPVGHKAEIILLPEIKGQNKVVKSSEVGTLYDIGDGVICLEMHTRTSAISSALISFIKEVQEELKQNWEGLVITGSGKNFCVGADLTQIISLIQDKRWDDIDKVLKAAQDVYMFNKYSDKPVVIAPFGRVLGGGCELTMQSSAIQALGETYIGLVEVGVGLIPAGGGIKEMVIRALDRIKGTKAHPVDFVMPYFENIAMAKVSTSAKEAVELGYLRPTDRITMNEDYLIADAKAKVLQLLAENYCPPVSRPFPAPGQNGLALLKVGTRQMMQAGVITEYDWHIACKIIDVMAGGSVTPGAMITEQYLLDLEREAFISLCGEQKTVDRIVHMLTKGKPLRN